jgi:hypothetical protein
MVYNLNTLPATSSVLKGLDVDPKGKGEIDFETDAYNYIMSEISRLNLKGTYWEILN